MQGYSSVLQCNTPEGVKVKRIYPLHGVGGDFIHDTGAPGMRYTGIYTVQTTGGKTAYLVIGRSVEASNLFYYEVKAYTIERGQIDDKILFFKTNKKHSNEVGYEEELSGGDFKNPKLPEIHFSKDMKLLFIPCGGEKPLKLTGRYLTYKFDGNNYVFDKKAK